MISKQPIQVFSNLLGLVLLLALACGTAPAAPDPTAAPASEPALVPVAGETPQPTPAPLAEATPTAAPPVVAQSAGTLNMGMGELGIAEGHPSLAIVPGTMTINRSVGESAIQVQQDLSPEGLLVEMWDISSDLLTWTFTMQKGVQFHKGYGEMTAEDFVYSQNQFAQGLHGRARDMENFWNHPDGSLEFLDAYTVRVNTGVPWVDGLVFAWMRNQGEGGTWTVSKRQSEELGVEAASKDIAATGSWEIVDSRPSQYWRFRAVENHWRQTPYFDELVFWEIPEESTRLAGFQTGRLDTFDMSFDSISLVEAVPGARLMSIPNAGQAAVHLYGQTYTRVGTPDQSPSYDPDLAWVSGNLDPTSDDWEKARKAREALAISVDRQTIVDTLLQGFGRPLVIPNWAGHEHRMPEKWQFGFDPDRARQLLTEAGYPNGFSITLTPAIRAAPAEVEACQAVAQMWRDIGIDVREQNIPWATFYPSIIDRSYQGGTCHSSPLRMLLAQPASQFLDTAQFNWGTFHPQLEELAIAATTEMDPEKRMQREVEFWDWFYDHTLGFGLYSFDAIWPVGPNIQEWQPDGYDFVNSVTGFQFIRHRE